MTTGSARLLADRSGKLCKPFPVALRCMPSDSAGDDSRFLLITHYSRVNLAKIHRDNVIAGRIFRLFAILNNQVPIVAPSFLIVDQVHLQEAQNVPQLSGNIDNYLGITLAGGKLQPIVSASNGGVLPYGCPEALTLVWVRGIQSCFAASPSGFTSLKVNAKLIALIFHVDII
jgi:hypothetical protein